MERGIQGLCIRKSWRYSNFKEKLGGGGFCIYKNHGERNTYGSKSKIMERQLLRNDDVSTIFKFKEKLGGGGNLYFQKSWSSKSKIMERQLLRAVTLSTIFK